MFWSKIWFFLIGVAAAVAIGLALVMPTPSARSVLDSENERLLRARWGVEMLLRENARQRVDLALYFARLSPPDQRLKLDAILGEASNAEKISQDQHTTTTAALEYILAQLSGAEKPELVAALDNQGRVVARVGVEAKEWGDDVSGWFLVRDALRGYMRDDLWLVGGKLYRVAASPVISHGGNDRYVGAIVLGDEVDLPLAKGLEERVSSDCSTPGPDGSRTCETHVAFFARGSVIATSESSPVTEDIKAKFVELKDQLDKKDEKGRALQAPPFTMTSGSKTYGVVLRRLPGEVAAQDGFFAVFSERPKKIGFMGTLKSVAGDDLKFGGGFPWIPLGVLFLVAIGGGLALMWWEADRPVRRLTEDAILLGKGDRQKLDEDLKGKFGSIARSVNLALDKLAREAKTGGRRDLGALLGDDGPTRDLPSQKLPPSPPGGPRGGAFAPPPVSDFALGDGPKNDVPHGGGFEFDIPPPPPPSAPPPPPVVSAPRPPAPVSLGRPPAPPMGGPGLAPQSAPPSKAPPPIPGSPPRPAQPPPRPTGAAIPPPLTLDDDILGGGEEDVLAALSSNPSAVTTEHRPSQHRADFGGATVVADPSQDLLAEASGDPEARYFRQVYDDFLELKRKCGEPTEGLTYEKFSVKLRQNKEQLVAKYNCRAVKFQVYVKDGKAALKATPVKT